MEATILIVSLFIMVCSVASLAASLCMLGGMMRMSERVRDLVLYVEREEKYKSSKRSEFAQKIREN